MTFAIYRQHYFTWSLVVPIVTRILFADAVYFYVFVVTFDLTNEYWGSSELSESSSKFRFDSWFVASFCPKNSIMDEVMEWN